MFFSILCWKSLSFNDLYDSSWHWLKQSLNNFDWNFIFPAPHELQPADQKEFRVEGIFY